MVESAFKAGTDMAQKTKQFIDNDPTAREVSHWQIRSLILSYHLFRRSPQVSDGAWRVGRVASQYASSVINEVANQGKIWKNSC